MPRLAIVISANGNTEALEGTLVSVLENRPSDCEIVIALNQPYADPYDLKGEVRFVTTAAHAASLAPTIAALETVKSPFVHLLSSGCKVFDGWADRALQRFGDRQVAAVVPLVVRTDDEERIFAAGVGYRANGRRFRVAQDARKLEGDTISQIVGPGSFAAFYRRSAIDQVGGLTPALGRTQIDIDLALGFGASGMTIVLEPQSRVAAAADVDVELPGYRRALAEERLFWRHLDAKRRWQTVAAHAALVTWEAIRSAPRPCAVTQLVGRFAGCLLPSRRPTAPAAPPTGPAPRGQGPWRIDRPHLGTPRGESSHATSTR